jgi:hypothetical protein
MPNGEWDSIKRLAIYLPASDELIVEAKIVVTVVEGLPDGRRQKHSYNVDRLEQKIARAGTNRGN